MKNFFESLFSQKSQTSLIINQNNKSGQKPLLNQNISKLNSSTPTPMISRFAFYYKILTFKPFLVNYKDYPFALDCLLLKIDLNNAIISRHLEQVRLIQEQRIKILFEMQLKDITFSEKVSNYFVPKVPSGIWVTHKYTLEELEKLIQESELKIEEFSLTAMLLKVSWRLYDASVNLSILQKRFWLHHYLNYISLFKRSLYNSLFRIKLALTSCKVLSLRVIGNLYNIYISFKHIFERTIFVFGERFAFNKKWMSNRLLPKWNKIPATSFVVPGYSVKSRYTVFVNGNIQCNSKIIHHKYDFDKHILFMQDSLNRHSLSMYNLQCELFVSYEFSSISNLFLAASKIEHCLNLIRKNTSIIESNLSRFRALVPISSQQELIYHKYHLAIFRFDSNLFNNLSGLKTIYSRLQEIKETLQKINLEKGYVLSTNLFDGNIYPIISDVIPIFISLDEFNNLNNYFKTTCYKWIINIIILNFYTICNKCLKILDSIIFNTIIQEMKILEIKSQFKCLSQWSYSMLDNSIKQHLQLRHINISSEIMTGFDTEYLPIDWGINKLLSGQLSFSHILKLSIPIFKQFTFEGINTLTSDNYIKVPPKFSEVPLLTDFITNKIIENRFYKFQNHDSIMLKIANYFASNEAVLSVSVTSRNILIQFSKSMIRNLFIIPQHGEELKINFNSLINLITHNCVERDMAEEWLVNKFLNLNFSMISSAPVIDSKIAESWNSKTMVTSPIMDVILSNEENLRLNDIIGDRSDFRRILTFINNVNVSPDSESDSGLVEEESLESKLLNKGAELLEKEGELGGLDLIAPQEIQKDSFNLILNFRRKIYLAAHYNTADLTMLNDWDSVSYKNIDIIKKCFSSLNKSFKYLGNEKIFLRDTMLLTSAAAKRLKDIAYSYGLEKVELSTKYIEDMQLLFNEDFELFKKYAMNDSLITLIHMYFINDFSFKLGSINLPNTLGTLSSKYIKNKWQEDNYRGYQIDVNYPLGDVRSSHTPKGINFGGSTLEFSNLFIGSYRGGRNECFKYGIDKSRTWYDYDLTSCYSTIMSMMGQPVYEMTEPERLAALAKIFYW